jgi:hypothetical protein
MDSSQSPSPNDQRRFSTAERIIRLNPGDLSAPSPDAAPQLAPVDPTTPVPSAESFELMRQLEGLAHEVAVVSRRDSSDQGIKVQDGSNLSAGLQLVEPSIRVSLHDHLASDTPSFGRRRILTLVSFFMAACNWLASYRPSFGRLTPAALANFFITARDWLASYSRPSFGRLFATLTSFFIEGRDWFASHRSSFDRRTFPTANSPNEVAVAEKHSGVTPVRQSSLQDAPPQIASATQTAPAFTAPAPSAELVQQLEGMARDLVVLRRSVEDLAAKQERLADAHEQLAARQEQLAQNIEKAQAVQRNINHKMSPPPRRNASPEATGFRH